MHKIEKASLDNIERNIDLLSKLFPNCITETKVNSNGEVVLNKAINFDLLKQMLSRNELQGNEAYEFTWVGKKSSIVEANKPTNATLRPCFKESKNWNNTENVYIEGDNLESLKILQESYLGKVKVIYIDPPYNTGGDFIYRDDFKANQNEYAEQSGAVDEDLNQLVKNTDSNGRFHSDWCSMVYSRLLLCRNILADDGVIFISIDDHEQENMKKISDEIFGEDNFIAQIIWERAYSPVNLKKHFSECHDYILCYAKAVDKVKCNGLPKTSDALGRYKNPDNDPRGPWKAADSTVGPAVSERVYPLTLPSGRVVEPSSGRCWLYTPERFKELASDNRVWFGPEGDSVPAIKKFASEVKQTMTPMTIWKYSEVGHSQDASKALAKLFDGKSFFEYPKPVDLIKRCIMLYSDQSSIIMDFFSGSATTAHAVMQLNAEDDGDRKFIMVQLPEKCDEKSEAYKAGYKTICDIGEERIRRAAKKIHEEHPDAKFDDGFRVFKIDSSNMTDVGYTADGMTQDLLSQTTSNIKADRTDLDLLFDCLLKEGVEITYPYSSEEIDGCTVHDYNNGALIACFDENVSEIVMRKMAGKKPIRAIFRDSSFKTDADRINVEELFNLISPDTTVKVI